MKINISGRTIKYTNARINKSIDKGADSVIVSMPWIPGEDIEFDEIIKPYSYSPFTAEIDGEVLVTGKIYVTSPELNADSSILTLEGYSRTKDLVDSTTNPPFERIGATLLSLATEFCSNFGINVVQQGVDQEVNESIGRTTIGAQQRIYSYLQNLARQKGLLVSSSPTGDLLFLKANALQSPIASIAEGDPQFVAIETGIDFAVSYDGTKRYNTYKVLGESQVSYIAPVTGVAIDPAVTSPRFRSFSANDVTQGSALQAAIWAKNVTVASSLEVMLPLPGFKTISGILWKENTIVTLTSPTMFIRSGFNFLIRSVEYSSDAEFGDTVILDLVPPQLYTKEEVIEPWL